MTDPVTAALSALPGPRRMELLEQATAAVHALDPRPCGVPSRRYACDPMCRPCLRAIGLEVLRLAASTGDVTL